MQPVKTIWKYAIAAGEEVEQLWAPGTKIVHAYSHPNDPTKMCFWVEHDPALAGTGRAVTLKFFGTGHDIPDGYSHVGSAVCGPFVWHLYARYH